MSGSWNTAPVLAGNPAYLASINVLGAHYPCRGNPMGTSCAGNAGTGVANNAIGQTLGIPIWASEMGSDPNPLTASSTLARAFNNQYLEGKITAAINWSTIASWYKNITGWWQSGLLQAKTPWSGYYDAEKQGLWTVAHTTQFTSPGWRYMDSASGRISGTTSTANGTYVTLKSPTNADWTTVVETTQATQSSTLTFTGVTAPAVYVWSTNIGSGFSDWFVRQAPLVPVDGTVTVPVAANHLYTITTLDTGRKGSHGTPPAPSTLPIPYLEDFEDTAVGETPKLWSQQESTWFPAPCRVPNAKSNPNNHCYQQMSLQRPIGWRSNISWTYTLVGDPDWTGSKADYRVTVDALFDQPGYVELLGRIQGFDLSPAGLAGYHFRVDRNGSWRLYRESLSNVETNLATGSVASLADGWHSLALAFAGSQIRGFIDGEQVLEVTNTTHNSGQSGLYVDTFRTAQFDNFRITPTGSFTAPSVTAPPAQEIRSGDTYTASGSFTDDDSLNWTATVDYGDGTGVQPLPLGPDQTFELTHTYRYAGLFPVRVTITDDDGNVGTAAVNVNVTVNAGSTVGGNVPATLALSLGAPVSFGAFVPGVERTYAAGTTASVTSTAGDATLSVSDPSEHAPGHLVNGTFSLPSSLEATGGAGSGAVGADPLTLHTWAQPASNASVPIEFSQHIGATDALRTGSYAKTLIFTLSTTSP